MAIVLSEAKLQAMVDAIADNRTRIAYTDPIGGHREENYGSMSDLLKAYNVYKGLLDAQNGTTAPIRIVRITTDAGWR